MLTINLITPERVIFNGQATAINLPGEKAPFAVLQNHIALISTLSAGQIVVHKTSSETMVFIISSGLVEVKDNVVFIMANNVRDKNETDHTFS